MLSWVLSLTVFSCNVTLSGGFRFSALFGEQVHLRLSVDSRGRASGLSPESWFSGQDADPNDIPVAVHIYGKPYSYVFLVVRDNCLVRLYL